MEVLSKWTIMIKRIFPEVYIFLYDDTYPKGIVRRRYINATLTFVSGWLEIKGREVNSYFIDIEAVRLYPSKRINRVIKGVNKIDLRKFKKASF